MISCRYWQINPYFQEIISGVIQNHHLWNIRRNSAFYFFFYAFTCLRRWIQCLCIGENDHRTWSQKFQYVLTLSSLFLKMRKLILSLSYLFLNINEIPNVNVFCKALYKCKSMIDVVNLCPVRWRSYTKCWMWRHTKG